MISLAPMPLAATIVFAIAMLSAAISDLTTMTIRNWLVLGLLLLYLAMAPLAGFELRDIGLSSLVGGIVLVCGFAIFAFGWIGGGDAKLAAVTAIWLGADQLLPYLVYMATFGGALTVLLLAFRRMPLPAGWSGQAWIARLHSRTSGIPYGIAMAAAGLLVFFDTPWVAAS